MKLKIIPVKFVLTIWLVRAFYVVLSCVSVAGFCARQFAVRYLDLL